MNLKKLLCLVLTTVICLSVFAGCAGNGTTAVEPSGSADTNTPAQTTDDNAALEGEITFWHCFTQGARMEVIDAAAAAFMDANPGVTINIETMSLGNFNTKWNAGLTTGDLPDMSVAQNTGEVAEMINAGVLADIGAVVDGIGRNRFSENALGDMTVDGVT